LVDTDFSQNGSEWRVANSEWFSGGQCSCTAEKFGASGDAPSRIFRRMNSALRKIRHQPLAKASGMKSFQTLPMAMDKRDGLRHNNRRL
jgi:hypothetical protein